MANSKSNVVLVSALILLFTASSCNKDKETVTISLKPTFGQEELKLNTYYTKDSGDSLKFSKLKLFLSEVSLIDKNGKKIMLKDLVFFNLVQGELLNLSTISDEIKSGNYTKISFNFGATATQNNTDPATVACPNPLCADNDMWWGNRLKYTNIKLEGYSSLSSSGSFLYHVGTTDNFRNYVFEKEITVSEGNNTQLNIQLDLKSLLSNFDMASENVTHTEDFPLVSTKFANKFQSAITIL